MRPERYSVFISYCHHDRPWLDRVNVHLKPLVRSKVVVTWDDTRIEAGANWKDEIEAALSAAKVAVLLVSADYLASDFVAQSELPQLLSAARDDGALILPLILSPSRFLQTPSISQFQSLNSPSRPLIGLAPSEQEEVLLNLSVAIEKAMSAVDHVVRADETKETKKVIPLIEKMPLSDCLLEIGCRKELVAAEGAFIRNWIETRIEQGFWRSSGGPEVGDFLKHHNEPEKVIHEVDYFSDQLLACCAPAHHRLGTFYLSGKKVNDVNRTLLRLRGPGSVEESDWSFEDKLASIHEHLLREDRITFLPATILLGGNLPDKDNEFCYFSGRFTLDVDMQELSKVPGAMGAMTLKDSKSLYGVVSNVFQNSDPFAYTLLRFIGHIGRFAVTMVLSRKYIHFGSMTASNLADALSGNSLLINGVGTIKRVGDFYELHPLACGGSF